MGDHDNTIDRLIVLVNVLKWNKSQCQYARQFPKDPEAKRDLHRFQQNIYKLEAEIRTLGGKP